MLLTLISRSIPQFQQGFQVGRGVLENVTTEDLQTHHEKLLLWQHIAQVQAAEIESLLTEISFFKRKDSDVQLLRSILDRHHAVGEGGDHGVTIAGEELHPPLTEAGVEPGKGVFEVSADLLPKSQPASEPLDTVHATSGNEGAELTEQNARSSLDFSFFSYLPIFSDGSFVVSNANVLQNSDTTVSDNPDKSSVGDSTT